MQHRTAELLGEVQADSLHPVVTRRATEVAASSRVELRHGDHGLRRATAGRMHRLGRLPALRRRNDTSVAGVLR